MDLSRSRVVLRQRSTLDVLDLSLRFVVEHARAYARVAAAAALPAALVSWAVARTAGWMWGWAATLSLALLVQAPFTVLASRLVFEPEVRLRDVLAASMRALPRIFVLRLLEAVMVAVGLVLFVAPGLWIAIAHLFIVEALVLEGGALSAAVARSQRLVHGESGHAVAAGLALFALTAGAVLLGDDVGRAVASDFLQFREPEAIWAAGGSAFGLAGFWLFLPYAVTARFFVYIDLRTRSEGWDIQTQLSAIALRDRDGNVAA